MFEQMQDDLKDESEELITHIISNDIDSARNFIESLLNDNIILFNNLVSKCHLGEHKDTYSDRYYKFEKIRTSIVGYLLCIDYDWSTLEKDNIKRYKCTHAVISLNTNINSLSFFNFGPDTKSNREHQIEFRKLFTFKNLRDFRIKQLNIN